MAPELRLWVPDEKEMIVLRRLSSVGGIKVLGRLPSVEEQEELARKSKKKLEKLLVSLKEPKQRGVQRKINSGYRKLFNDAMRGYQTLYRPVEAGELRRIVIDHFQHLPDSPSRTEITGAEVLIFKYGLADGRPKTYKEAGKQIGVSERRAGYLANRVRVSLAISLSGSLMVSRSPTGSAL